MNYSYPIDETWSQQEIIDVVNFFNLVELAYEKKVQRDDILAVYRRFKQIVPSKSEEKQLFAAFTKASGYAPYPVIKQARNTNEKNIRV